MSDFPDDYKSVMSQFRFSILKTGFWFSVILAILKLTNTCDISGWIVFLPLMVAFGFVFLVIFAIGLITVYLLAKEQKEKEEEEENDSSDE